MAEKQIDPDDLVVEAEQKAAEAEALVTAIEDRIVAGDDTVTHEDLTTQISVARFAKRLVEAARTKATGIKVQRRLDAANKLREEIEAYEVEAGKRLAEHLRDIVAAEKLFTAEADKRQTLVSEWTNRARQLGIPAADARPIPPKADGGLAVGNVGGFALRAGRREISNFNARATLDRLRNGDPEKVIAGVEQLDSIVPEPTARFFYRGEGGAVFGFEDDLDPEYVRAHHMVQLSRAEAWGDE